MNSNRYYLKDYFNKTDIFKDSNSYVIDNENKTSYFLDLDCGKGNIISYHVFNGIDLQFNSFNSLNCNQLRFTPDEDLIVINHCNKGRYECRVQGDILLYLGEGELAASISSIDYDISEFPLGYYEGLEISFDCKVAQKSLDEFIGVGEINLSELFNKLKENGGFVIVGAKDEINHIIGEIYEVDDNINEVYFKLKIVEFLIFLLKLEIGDTNTNKNHCSLKHVTIVKRIKNYLIDNLDTNITLNDLSNRYGISKTSIKNCFKEVYGKSIFQWRKEYRLQVAANLLISSDKSIKEISTEIGYKNHSKFSSAFKEYFELTPSSYRSLKK
ncbi:helix-turn-helix transcriptional regulator [Methanobrevibacter oralis]|uniref:Exoenzyme S synthesis regulatory protein ExsA n=1 Tax=Methanobrevibacter oralis TaxID=66851 RepID=A0A166BR72_METOA|nr:AraC family transcriptional regulator [Methanobrevibacter oralis]KZX13712.1 exoenzyme S synthesis regulatory protein ExsA [Methanobrevibacter oralis]